VVPTIVMLCAAIGCWQEVEYTGPDPSTTTSASEAPPSEEELPIVTTEPPSTSATLPAESSVEESTGFADDFANSLAEPPMEPSAEPEPGDTIPLGGVDGATPPSDELASEPASVEIPTTPPSNEQAAVAVDKYAIPVPEESESPTNMDTMASDTSSEPTDVAAVPETSSESPIADTSTDAGVPETATPSVAPDSTDTTEAVADNSTTETQAPGETTASDAAAPQEAIVNNPRLNAWRLGSKLSLAAMANDRGLAAESVPRWMEYCKALASALQTTVADLPARGLAADRPASRQLLNYLVIQQGQQVGRDLTDRYGPDAAALFEVAVKSNLLLVLYSPGSSSTNAIAAAISGAAPRAQLPANLWQPLVNMVTAQADADEVRKAVKSFHAEVERHLAERAEQ
jgi:hypothetical protein